MRTTNTQFLTNIMEFSPHGALMQVFILEAIYNYSRAVANAPASEDNFGALIGQEAWQGCANELIKKLDERFKEAS